jgi:hypothetical protein
MNSYQPNTKQEYFSEGGSRSVVLSTSNLRAEDIGEAGYGKMDTD